MEKMSQFLEFLSDTKGQKERTVRTNNKIIKKILNDVYPLNAVTFNAFTAKLIAERKSPSYIKQHISIIKQWGECFAIEELQMLKYPKIFYKSEFVRATFTDNEIDTFLNLPNPHENPASQRPSKGIYKERYQMWLMFYWILFYHGFRPREVSLLEPSMIDFGRSVIILPPSITKTKEYRMMPISKAVYDLLYNYVSLLKTEYLFPSFHKTTKDRGTNTVQEGDWNYFFKNQLTRIGLVRRNLNPYSCRHSYATRQLASGTNLSVLMDLLGHKNLTTTQKYLHNNLDELRKAQDNDRLLELKKLPKEMLDDIYEKEREIETKYKKKIYSVINLSEDGTVLVATFRVRK